MSTPSQWPLTTEAVRQITPGFILKHLQNNPLTRACFPTAFGYYPCAQGHVMQRESHNDNLLIYCEQGRGHISTRYFDGPVTPGDVIVLPADHPHEYRADVEQPWTIYWVHFDGLQAHQLIQELDFDPEQVVAHVGRLPLLASDFNRLLGLRQSGFSVSVFNYAAAITRQILYFLALQIRSSNIRRHHNFNLDELKSLMLEHIDGELDLETLAASTQLSRHHFSAKYKKLTGISPIKHFIHLKMERACHLLDASNAPAKLISAQMGYNDPLYFSRIFKKVIGMSPTEYRQRLKG